MMDTTITTTHCHPSNGVLAQSTSHTTEVNQRRRASRRGCVHTSKIKNAAETEPIARLHTTKKRYVNLHPNAHGAKSRTTGRDSDRPLRPIGTEDRHAGVTIPGIEVSKTQHGQQSNEKVGGEMGGAMGGMEGGGIRLARLAHNKLRVFRTKWLLRNLSPSVISSLQPSRAHLSLVWFSHIHQWCSHSNQHRTPCVPTDALGLATTLEYQRSRRTSVQK